MVLMLRIGSYGCSTDRRWNPWTGFLRKEIVLAFLTNVNSVLTCFKYWCNLIIIESCLVMLLSTNSDYGRNKVDFLLSLLLH